MLEQFKIQDTDVATKGVVAAPTVLNGTPIENKKLFDRLIREVVKDDFNGLIDQLEAYGVGNAVLLPTGAGFKYIRVNVHHELEVSLDGLTWQVTGDAEEAAARAEASAASAAEDAETAQEAAATVGPVLVAAAQVAEDAAQVAQDKAAAATSASAAQTAQAGATNAKTAAETARDAAVAAKTAAQTAQAAAETAAERDTAAWLADHITNPSNPPLDTSLSVANAAADAKATGDKISDLKSALNVNDEKTIELYDNLGFEYNVFKQVETKARYTRYTVFSGLTIKAGVAYRIKVVPISTTTTAYYAYVVDSQGNETGFNATNSGITGTYTPQSDMENVSIKVSADVTEHQTLSVAFYKIESGDNIVKRMADVEDLTDDTTEKLLELYDDLGYEYITYHRTTTPGANTRVTVLDGLSLTAGEPYAVIVKPVTVTTNYYYAYLHDSNNNVLATFQVLSGQTQIDGTYIPESNLTGVSLKVSASVSAQQTLDVAFYKREADYCIVERVDNLFDGTKVAEYILINKMYVKNSDGLLYADDESKASSFVPVRPGDVIEISNLYIEGVRSICAYDKKQQFISAISWGTTAKKKKITVPDNAYFIRFTSQLTGTTVLKFLSIPKYIEDNAIRSIPLTITNGKFISKYPGYEGTEDSDLDSACTGFVPVLPGSCICITGAKLGGNRSVCAYDTKKQFCKVIMSDATRESFDSKNILLPENARYIRATCEPNTPPVVKYSSYVFNDDFIIPKYISGKSLFDTAASKPVLSIIDDDTWDTEYVTRIKEDLYDENNVKASFAGLTSRMENNPTLVNALIEFEREGFPVIMHGYTQGNFYRYDPQYRDLARCEADLVRGIHDMNGYGFADYKIWVTPFGSCDADLQKLGIKWGFIGMVDCTQPPARFVNPKELSAMNQYYIRRLSFDDPEDVPSAKDLIDAAKLVNGWVLIATHSAATNWYNGTNDAAFAEVIQYARTNGFEIRTINEELRRRMPIYNYYSKY